MSDPVANDHAPARGKINRLSLEIREGLNRRLREGKMGPSVLPWLNAQPEVRAVLNEDFEGVDVSPQNLSEWRSGGYAKWLRGQERVEQIAALSRMSMELARASGGNLSEGAVAVAGGQILEVLENVASLPFAVEKGDPTPNLTALVDSLVALRGDGDRHAQVADRTHQGRAKGRATDVRATEVAAPDAGAFPQILRRPEGKRDHGIGLGQSREDGRIERVDVRSEPVRNLIHG